MKRQNVSDAVIRRLPRYYRYLDDLHIRGTVRISSSTLGEKMGITASQIRQDLSCFGEFGQQGYGYNVEELRSEIGHILGVDNQHSIIIVGVGNLGRALMQNFHFHDTGFLLEAAFDVSPALVGSQVAGTPILDMTELDQFVRAHRPDVAVLTVPQAAAQQTAEPEPVPTPEPLGGAIPPQNAVFGMTEATAGFSETILSEYGVFIDAQSGEILAQKMPGALVSPASMTKILTILTAADHIGGLNGTYVITQEMVDYCRSNGCSTAGFLPGEEVSLTDLFYGTILPSGADAALALACYVAGSQEAFVELMNQKARELGLSSSARFANCIGLYDPDNVCTVYDMAMILWAAMENDVCRTFLTERNRVLPPNGVREEELDLSNWFIRRIEDHMPEGLAVLGAKTGYVSMAGSCAASFAQSRDGREYICVTAKASGGWQCIFDQAAIYAAWAGR